MSLYLNSLALTHIRNLPLLPFAPQSIPRGSGNMQPPLITVQELVRQYSRESVERGVARHMRFMFMQTSIRKDTVPTLIVS